MRKYTKLCLVFVMVMSLTLLPVTSLLVYADNIDAGDGDDNVSGSPRDDMIYGGTGNDTIDAGDGDDEVYGQEDNDTINGGAGDDFIDGGSGDDSIDGGTGDDIIDGSTGDDTLNGDEDTDLIFGGDGDDTINGGDGDDNYNESIDHYGGLFGEDGNDTINGGSGDDYLFGGDGKDKLNGDDGDDLLSGDSGNDKLNGGKGDDFLVGGSLEEWADYDISQEQEDIEDEANTPDNDSSELSDGNDILKGGKGDDSLIGGTGNDTLKGGKGDDHLLGDGLGNEDSDTIDGGKGDDVAYYEGSYEDYDVVIRGENDEETGEMDTFLTVTIGDATDDLSNVENLDFDYYDNDDIDFEDIVFIELDGTIDRIVRNRATEDYTVYWGYDNSNYFTAYEDEHYFEDNNNIIFDPEDKTFDVGRQSEAFETTSGLLQQRWILGGKVIIADATKVEEEFQRRFYEFNSGKDSADKDLLELWLLIQKEIYKLFEDAGKSDHPAKDSVVRLAKIGLFTDYEAVVRDIDEIISIGEAIEILNTLLEDDLTEKLDISYEEENALTKEIMTELFTTAFELDEEEIAELNLQVTDENKEEEVTNGQFYIHLVNCLF